MSPVYIFNIICWFNPLLIIVIPDDVAVDNKNHWHTNHPVKSEYTLPEASSGVGQASGGHSDPGSILPDSSAQSLPPLMHMGYAVSRPQHGLLQQAAMCPYTQKTGW